MPTISVKKSWLDKRLEKNYTQEEFDELCFDYGLELDEITTEKQQIEKEKGLLHHGPDGDKPSTVVADETPVYKIEVPANRYDLLCGEGISRALTVYLKKQKTPVYLKVRPKNGKLERLVVKKEVAKFRPYAVAAILRNVTLNADSYASFIDLQDKLHQNLCRKRVLVAIGSHDLDTIEGPFTYTAMEPTKLKFVPLNKTQEYTAAEMMKLYSTDSHLRPYLHIIENDPLYPVIVDKNGHVLSMPPIINGDRTKITLNTKNIFLEATATDLTRAKIVMDTLVTMFSEYCAEPFTVEPVEVEQADGSVTVYPELNYWTVDVSVQEINLKIGINITQKQIVDYLELMCLKADKLSDETVRVSVPPTRHDILHACDIIEDVAVAYGFNNVKMVIPSTSTISGQTPLNKLTDLLRYEIAQAGFTEVLTFSLCSKDDIWSKLRHEPNQEAVHIGNPKSLEFQVARTTLIPGILKTIGYNKDVSLPIKLFEIQDVVLKDDNADVGARNERRFCAAYYNKTSGFEVIHGLLDRFMELLSIPFGKDDHHYYIKSADDKTYFPGRCAEIYGPGHKLIGKLGVLHPEVLAAFELHLPCSVLEVNVEPFL